MKKVIATALVMVLSGLVYGESTLLGYVFKTPENKEPVKGAVVKLQGTNGKVYYSEPTPEDGSYIIKGIQKGKYRVSVIYKNREYRVVFTRPGEKPREHPVLIKGGTLIISLALKPGRELLAIIILGGAALTGGIYEFGGKEERVSPIK